MSKDKNKLTEQDVNIAAVSAPGGPKPAMMPSRRKISITGKDLKDQQVVSTGPSGLKEN